MDATEHGCDYYRKSLVYMVGVSCASCDACWPTYEDLKLHIQGLPHAIGQAEITYKDGTVT